MREPDEIENRLSNEVIGAAIEVHRELGPGYHESIYENAMEHEFALRRISFFRQPIFGVQYKTISVGQGRLDYLVGDVLIVEMKTVEKVLPVHKAQVISYLSKEAGPWTIIEFQCLSYARRNLSNYPE
jgi:GxxExxY protein